jgi:hypothetical protein
MSKDCRGLVLTDPYFHLEQEKTKIVLEIRGWVMWAKLSSLTRYLFHGLRSVYLAVKRLPLAFRRNGLPKNANLPLLRCWHQVTSAGIPILIMQSPHWTAINPKPGIGQFDYLGHLQSSSGRNQRTTVKLIEGTNHTFADRVGRAAFREQTELWLTALFPQHDSDELACLNSLQSVVSEVRQ